MQYLRLLLLPFSWLYALIIWLRNKAYDRAIFRSFKFELPVIGVGNLAVGGAGKSPMSEYIIRLLQHKLRVAVLSRGYGRKTKGFRLVTVNDTAEQVGDEPLQFRQKFSNITVAVSEKRVLGIEKLKDSHDLIILDDAFQHRAVVPGLNILLFDYTRLDEFMLILPAGNLREPFSGRKRADIIVVTKTPQELSEKDRREAIGRIKPFPGQKVFFSYLDYGKLVPLNNSYPMPGVPDNLLLTSNPSLRIFLLTGIANPYPLVNKLKEFTDQITHYDYPDHHPFSKKNIAKLVSDFKADTAQNKIIVTTEKDAQRLKSAKLQELLKNLPVFYLPVSAIINPADEEGFDKMIEQYATGNLQYY